MTRFAHCLILPCDEFYSSNSWHPNNFFLFHGYLLRSIFFLTYSILTHFINFNILGVKNSNSTLLNRTLSMRISGNWFLATQASHSGVHKARIMGSQFVIYDPRIQSLQSTFGLIFPLLSL